MTKTALLTGASGFVSRHLIKELQTRGWEITGLIPPFETVEPNDDLLGTIKTVTGDLLDIDSLRSVFEQVQPDNIFHLAAESAPSKSFDQPEKFFEVNVLGTQNLLEVARLGKLNQRFALFTSSDIYGIIDQTKIPVKEDTPLAPTNPYAASKVACHLVAQQYAMHFGLSIVEVRPFNMVGPHQSPGFVLPDWCQQVAKIIKGSKQAKMRVGRLTDQRDFIDVRDAARAMADIFENGKSGEVYHVCSGKGTLVQDVLNALLKAAGKKITVEQNPDLLRPTKMPIVVGSHEKLTELTGWKPQIDLEQTISDTLKFWLEQV